MKIDIHAHVYPQKMTAAFNRVKSQFPHVQMEESDQGVRYQIGSEVWTRPVAKGLVTIERREEDLARKGIAIQLNAGWLDITGYTLPAEEGARWSRFLNEHLAESLGNRQQFKSLATVPLQDGDLAAKELLQAKQDGHVGVMVGSFIPGLGDLDAPHLTPFWQAAAEESFPIFLHPVFANSEPRAKDWGMVNAVVRPNETAISMARLLYAGIPQRFPGLKLILSHGGGSLPMMLGRLSRNYTVLRNQGEEVYDPAQGFQSVYFDSVVFDPRALSFLVSLTDADHILLGSDDPFPIGDPAPTRVIEECEILSERDRAKIYHENATNLFGLNLES